MANPQDVAEKIAKKAQESLDDLRLEMTLRKWPADFRAIMWRAVSETALGLAMDAEKER